MPGFAVTEIAPWQESAQRWRALRVRFLDEIASHSNEHLCGARRRHRVPAAFCTAWNGERERRAGGPAVRLCPKATVMSLDDRAADKQPDAHAAALRGVEGIE
jgi:hypothetical protein